MKCPRCETSKLDEREREGIVIDVCQNCRGLWLDRGELEKLIARATRDYEELAPRQESAPAQYSRPPQYSQPPPSSRPPQYSQPLQHHPQQHHDDDYYRRHPKRKKQWFESLGDIFD